MKPVMLDSSKRDMSNRALLRSDPPVNKPPLTLQEAAKMLRSGLVTSTELTSMCIELADNLDASLGTFVTRFNNQSLETAERADAEIAAGIDRGPLHGIPIAIKDIIAVSEGPTFAQSLVLDPSWGNNREGPVIKRLKDAGAVMMGKTTTSEFAIGIPDPTKPFPIPRNPWDLARWPGGSSSGTANGIAAGLFLGGIGSDTGGSIRIPAAFCGISGLMPTFGRVPISDSVPLSFSLDRIGPLARSAWDCAAILQTIAGHDSSDINSAAKPVPDYLSTIEQKITGLRVGVLPLNELFDLEAITESVFASAVGILQSLGAHIEHTEIPYYKEVCASNAITLVTEALAFHTNDLQCRWLDYNSATREFLLRGLLVTGSDYVQAQRVRKIGQNEIAKLFLRYDVLVIPTVSKSAPLYNELSLLGLKNLAKYNTNYWNAVGNPAISIPMGFTENGLPLGIQIASRPFDEATLLQVANAFQKVTDWHLRLPLIRTEQKKELGVSPAGTSNAKKELLQVSPAAVNSVYSGENYELIAAALTSISGIAPSEEEVATLVRNTHDFRSTIKSIYAIPEVRYEGMVLKFLAELE